ncbi:hypothetical protein [uncultured Thiothrix sp.]|jgi:hypothetical protein|uniref:hypothetical protein n=1 Tax=uncultured Thiothrix sp. TaxID=223185 RepID=UPI0026108857|nr:hypothetical protein [uncultured Thiothrix sp.]HMT91785.1 hypothetical protein [Thiolinea sp.]
MPQTLQKSIEHQRARLIELLGASLKHYAATLQTRLQDRQLLDEQLRLIFKAIDHCKYVYVLDTQAVQISSTINRYGLELSDYQRDRSTRPYLQHIYDDRIDFNLSAAYMSRNKKRPSLTAIQTIRDAQGQRLGFLGVDYDLRELPHSEMIYEEPSKWRQIKGDPAIRQGLFTQERVESLLDKQIDHVLSVHEALVVDQGVHDFQLHFSASRSTIWHVDDPYVYRILTMEELADTNICLAYPRRSYFDRAIVPREQIKKILRQFKALRFADEIIYLRTASLNIVNGKVGLNFSCDGTHYLSYDEFLSKGLSFWIGGDLNEPTTETKVIDTTKLDQAIDTLATQGCMAVNLLLASLDNDEIPSSLQIYTKAERDYIYHELKTVMNVYENGICGL